MTPTGSRIELRSYFVWMGDDGVVRIVHKPGVRAEVADAVSVLDAGLQVGGGARTAVLLDTGGSGGLSREARHLLAGPRSAVAFYAAAFMVRSPFSRAIGNFFVGINRPLIPFRLFEDEAAAIAWLKLQPCP